MTIDSVFVKRRMAPTDALAPFSFVMLRAGASTLSKGPRLIAQGSVSTGFALGRLFISKPHVKKGPGGFQSPGASLDEQVPGLMARRLPDRSPRPRG